MLENNNMCSLTVASSFCESLAVYREASCPAGKEQFSKDIERVADVYIKNQEGIKSVWSDTLDRKDREEIFFKKLTELDPHFKDFINTHFHQGGQLYTGIRFLDMLVLGRLGLKPDPAYSTREFIFEPEKDQLVVEEVFRIKGLLFYPEGFPVFSFKPISKTEESYTLSESEEGKLAFLRDRLEEIFGKGYLECSLGKEGEGIYIDSIPFAKQEDNPALIEFRMKHTILLDKKSKEGVSLKPFEEKDFSISAYRKILDCDTLLDNSVPSSQEKWDFSTLLSPQLTVSHYRNSFRGKHQSFSEHVSDFSISSVHKLALVIFITVFKYFKLLRPHVMTAKPSEESQFLLKR